MGVIYEAEQLEPRRAVAVKVALRGRLTDEWETRIFQREAGVLARLRHPSIATIFDAGRSDDGEPYLVMELVRGVPLIEYARARELPLAGRLELFERICAGINYAHQQGIIHLDIKPTNILVEPDGLPKILDFGLARIVDDEAAFSTLLTEVGLIQGTLPYMSPEQIRGRRQVDLRSDIYSLCVILYELLVDQLPFPARDLTRHDLVKLVCEEAPPRLRSIRPKISKELETIVLKGLRKDPAERYQSASALGDDLRRYVTNQPIWACAPSTAYQCRKLIQRHRWGFAATALGLIGIIVFAVWMAALYGRAQKAELLAGERFRQAAAARGEAEHRALQHKEAAQSAQRLTHFLQDMVSSAYNYWGTTGIASVRQILDRAAGNVQRELSAHPDIEASMRVTLGTAYANLRLFDPAQEQFDAALRIQCAVHGDSDLSVAESLTYLSQMYLDAYRNHEAESCAREALSIRERLLPPDDPRLAQAQLQLGSVRLALGDVDQGERLGREALDGLERAYGAYHPHVAACLRHLASAQYIAGNFGQASDLARRSTEILDVVLGDPRETCKTLDVLSWSVRAEGDYAEAERIRRQSIAIIRGQLGFRHPYVAAELVALARLRYDVGHLSEAEALFREAIEINREAYDSDTIRLSESLSGLGGMFWAKGDYRAAESIFREVLDLESQREDNEIRMGGVLNSLGVVLRDADRFDEADDLFVQALKLTETAYGRRHRNTANVLNNRGRLLLMKDELASAEGLIREALSIRLDWFHPDHADVAETKMVLGLIRLESGHLEEAAELLGEALVIRKSCFSSDHVLVAEAQSALAAYWLSAQDFDTAEALLLQSLANAQSQLLEQHILNRLTFQRLVRLYSESKRSDIADYYAGCLANSLTRLSQ